jgi:hypothetical protein
MAANEAGEGRMSDNTATVLCIFAWALAMCVIVTGVCFLAYFGKDGWGWLIVLAVICCGFSAKFDGSKKEVGP